MNHYGFESNNNEFNPLFEKMRERFCQNGTVAEQLAERAAKYNKRKPKRVTAEQHMTVANFLPKASAANTKKRSFFSLKNINSACLLLLIAGTVLFSGATLGTLREEKSVRPTLLSEPSAKSEETMVLSDTMPWDHISSDITLDEERTDI